jgi:hypothetical protein
MIRDARKAFRRADVCVVSLVMVAVAYLIVASVTGGVVRGGAGDGSIQGYVATTLVTFQLGALRPVKGMKSALASTDLSAPIFLPDIDVWAKNLKTGIASSHVVTNPQGYFVITDLPRGSYQICVSGAGYNTQCDDHTVNVTHPADILDHVVAIQPSGNAIAGTVWLADRTTPCFWFRPAMDVHALTATVSLLDDNQRVVAGPVNGNTSGQYVLPTATGAGTGSLHAVCDTAVADTALVIPTGVAVQDVAINNRAPQILTLDFSKGGVGVRRASPGDVIRATVQASDLDGDQLHYRWVDDSGRSLGLPDAPSVDWPVLNASALNTLHVQVSDSRGGIATFSRTIESGPNAIFFAGRVFDRQSLAGIAKAIVNMNKVAAETDAGGNFHVSVPDAGQFVLNVTKPGYALASLVYRNRATNIAIPLDAVQTTAVSGTRGGTIQFPPAGCQCRCRKHDDDDHHRRHEGHDDDKDKDDDRDDKAAETKFDCGKGQGSGGNLIVGFPAGALVTSTGTKFNGVASVEGFQYDLTKQNPIPGDFGGVYQGKAVRLATFGAFHIQPRDAQGHALKMAAGKEASVSIPIQTAQLAMAPAVIPLFHYDEDTGSWLEDGTLTRTGNRYVGHIGHFSGFNADTVFPGGACVKVVLDSNFHLPVTLDASYFDPSAGTFNHNGTQSLDPIIGVERMRPNQNFTLTITDSLGAVVSVALNSGNPIDPANSTAGLDNDQVNFSHCNGPIQVFNNTIPPSRPYFLSFVSGGSITDHSANYQIATDAQTGGSRDTLVHWKQANGFLPTPTGEATAIYFNNGDLKFGRDMHCRVTNTATNALACYVSNFGNVGTDDAPAALADAVAYELSGQSPTAKQPGATVAMEYDPVKGVQFWAYHGEVVTGGVSDGGQYFPNPALDSQLNKPMPDICMGCHFGTYNNSTTTGVAGAVFLPFDMDSFKDQTDQLFPNHHPSAALQTQLHQLNNMIAGTSPPAAVTQLINQLWYANTTPATPFTFNQGAAQLPGTPFIDSNGVHHEPLYDNVVKDVCRTCHVANPFSWNTFTGTNTTSGMNNVPGSTIQFFACGLASKMPNAEVPWLRYWQESKSSTLASELSLSGCPNQ